MRSVAVEGDLLDHDIVELTDPEGIVFSLKVPIGEGARLHRFVDKLVRSYEREEELDKCLAEIATLCEKSPWQSPTLSQIRLLIKERQKEEPE